MARDHPGIAVHKLSPVPRRGPVFYASLPRGAETSTGARQRLVSVLWEHLVTMDKPLWTCRLSPDRAASPIRIVRDPLGKPFLLLGEQRGPAISFSESGGTVWAALCAGELDIGIDVAGANEFQGDFPFHRVFNAREQQDAEKLAGGDALKASALLWSVKEAVVKALGCGFHLVQPREISVQPAQDADGEYAFSIGLSRKALERVPGNAGRPIWAYSLPQGESWMSIAFQHWPGRSRNERPPTFST